MHLDIEALVRAAAAATAGVAGAGAAAGAAGAGEGPAAGPAGATVTVGGTSGSTSNGGATRPGRSREAAVAAAGAHPLTAAGGVAGAPATAAAYPDAAAATPTEAEAAAAILFGDGVPDLDADPDAAPQHYDHDTTSSDNAFPPPSPEELAAAGLPAAQAVVVADPYGNELVALLQHCHSCDRLGLAVQSYYGLPTMVMLYAPAALMPLAAQPPEAGGDGGAAAGDEGSFIAWPAAVYVVDLLAAKLQYGDGEDGHAAADALLVSLRPLLEAPGVTKVVHDGGAAAGRWGAAAAAAAGSGDGLGGTVAVLEAAVSASSAHLMVLGEDGVSLVQAAAGGPCRIAPLHDTRLVLRGLEAMLGLPHLPPAALAVPDADPTSSGVLGQLHDLHVHVTRLHDALAGTGLWADRPALLAALVARHSTALRHELLEACAYGGDGAAAAGMDGLLERPLGAGVVEAVAGDARHLPELWGETVATALPWVAERGAAAVHSS